MGEPVGMILCAGLGTRLRPLTGLLPKPAVPVCNVPLVRYTLGLLAGAGLRRAVINVHHLPGEMVEAARSAAEALGLALAVSHEPVLAGSGGALREARRLLAGADPVVVVNGDVLFDVDLAAALVAHRASGALATMVLMAMPPGATYATVEVDEAGRVRRLAGRFGPGGPGLTPWHFPGVHLLAPGLVERLPAEPFECDLNRHVYPPLMASGQVRSLLVAGYWNDLGEPHRYLQANLDVAAGRLPLGRFAGLPPLAPVSPDARLEPGARLGPEVVVGAGCRVGDGATLERAVLWPGTTVGDETVREAVAAGTHRVDASAPGA